MLQRLMLTLLLFSSIAFADEFSPWGDAKILDRDYKPQKVLYDVDYPTIEKLSNILDRVSLLNKLYQADSFHGSIVVILHGGSIKFFAKKHAKIYQTLIRRAYNLTLTHLIEFRMCEASAKALGYTAKDIHGFITMIPMADAEIIKLQREEGYAYMK